MQLKWIHAIEVAERGGRREEEKTLSNELNLDANVSSLLCLNECWVKAKSI